MAAANALAQGALVHHAPPARAAMTIYFEENSAGAENRIGFIGRGAGYIFFLAETEATAIFDHSHMSRRPDTLRWRLSGANRHSVMRGEEPLPSKSNYFIGNDASKWRTNVAHYARVRVINVYPGIDVVYYGRGDQLEFDFVVKAGADLSKIRLRYDGALRTDVEEDGDLVLSLTSGQLRQRLPLVYQEIGGTRRAVQARYRRLSKNEFGLDVGPHDTNHGLVIDPVLSYSTYLGGSAGEVAWGIAPDSAGNVYVTGYTFSTDFPTTAGSLRRTKPVGSIIAFVTKLDASGRLIYSTFLGGSAHTEAYGIAVDAAGNAYVTGMTYDHNLPIVNAAQPTFRGLNDVFIAKLNPTGSAVIYSTFLGGDISQAGYAIAVDGAGTAIVTGDTDSPNFPTSNALQSSIKGSVDPFVAKLTPSGSFVYVTLLGGTGIDRGTGAAIDGSGNGYIAGFTTSPDFPVTVGAFQTHSGGSEDGFIVKMNPTGTALVYSSYLGGSSVDTPFGLAVDPSGAAVIVGATFSPDFPTAHPLQPTRGTAFITKVSSSGSSLIYSTYFGGTMGSGNDAARAVAADSAGNVYIAGATGSIDIPILNAIQPTNGGSVDAFVSALNASGSLLYSTYLGGSGSDGAEAICVDSSGRAVVAGYTESTDFPLANAFQPNYGGGSSDAFVAAIGIPDVTIVKTHSGNFLQGQPDATYTIKVSNTGSGATSGPVTMVDTLPGGFVATSISGVGWTCTLGTLTCVRSDALSPQSSYPLLTLTVTVPVTTGTFTNTASISGGSEIDSSNNSASDATVVELNPAIPMLDSRALGALAVMLAAIALSVLRK
jgi:uncharacterized repeat protein (TIGR01451 family)